MKRIKEEDDNFLFLREVYEKYFNTVNKKFKKRFG
jgi:hypothetical protein